MTGEDKNKPEKGRYIYSIIKVSNGYLVKNNYDAEMGMRTEYKEQKVFNNIDDMCKWIKEYLS